MSKLKVQWQYLRGQPGFQKAPVAVSWRLFRWRLKCLSRQSQEITLPQRNFRLHLPPDWRGAAKLIYIFRDDYEPDLGVLAKFLGEGRVMLDVGANYGIFSLVASRLVGNSGQVFAFEPTKSTFAVLEKNLALNRIQNVRALQIALSDHGGKGRLYHDMDATRNSLAAAGNSQDFEEVEMRTLDEVLAEQNIERLDFVKIDVEGADELVCRGGQRSLAKWRPAVLFEHNPEAATRLKLEGCGTSGVLSGLGYEFYRYSNNHLIRQDINSLSEGNVLAMHPR